MVCRACNAENREGARFCKRCGAGLILACPSCGAAAESDQAFCDQCGSALGAATSAAAPVAESISAPSQDAAELRHVSVLFADLVGFTALSESRDSEDVRDLLGRYFDQAKTIIGRYGGTVSKFIGDAVMAVWGVPVAREDDAERAVRAGLELVEAVSVFGEEVGAPNLEARAGVVTGQVASVAKPDEGLVVGDRVNTASRVQSVADPGTVFVDEITRQVTTAAIAYENAGQHLVKGKAEPLRLFRALRAVAGVGGSQRPSGLEAPFVGREAELRLIKDLFHASADRGGARLVAISGPAGVGKSRVGWEFSNYTDGLADTVLWHSGRCLSYGEGVAYWALAEIVRQRLGVPEDAAENEAASRLAACLDEWIADRDERERIAPALGALIGTTEPGLEREELFASWRLFFERLSERDPVVMVFEDMQWADDGLLDFIEQLLDWSASHPIFVITLARPELSERRADWPAGVPCATAVQLDPLDDDAVGELLRGLVDELPGSTLRRIVAQAEGVPLYAVETVRTLIDRGALAQRDGHLELVGDIGDLDVPASLHSLLSARLDALSAEERELVKAMAVFGGSFPRASAFALADLSEDRLDDVLASLVGKQVLTVRTDPLSPNRGQYAFAQGMLRAVAYEMITKQERRPRHLAAAAHLRAAFPNEGEEVAEVIATHLLDAFRASPGDEDLRASTIAALRRAAQRAATVGSPDVAERSLRNAAELAVSEGERTGLIEEAGRMAINAGRSEAALALLDEAAGSHEANGRGREAARLAAPMGVALGRLGRNEEAITRMRAALERLGSEELDPDVAELNWGLGRALDYTGQVGEAEDFIERALDAAEALEAPALICRALELKGLHSMDVGRFEQAGALLDQAAAIAERHRLPIRVNVQGNAADLRIKRDMPDAVELVEAALATARELGNRSTESVNIGNLMMAQLLAGRWQEVERIGREALEGGDAERFENEDILFGLGLLHVRRGELDAARVRLAGIEAWERSDDLEARHLYRGLAGLIALGDSELERALELLSATAREAIRVQGGSSDGARLAWPEAVGVALELGRLDEAEELVDLLAGLPRGHLAPLLRAELARAQARLADARGEHDRVEASFAEALGVFIGLGYPFWLARAQTDRAAWLLRYGADEDPAPPLAEAAAIFERLGAAPELARVRKLGRAPAEALSV